MGGKGEGVGRGAVACRFFWSCLSEMFSGYSVLLTTFSSKMTAVDRKHSVAHLVFSFFLHILLRWNM